MPMQWSSSMRWPGRDSKEGPADFVAPAERIAVFDNDGMLWAKQPDPAGPGVWRTTLPPAAEKVMDYWGTIQGIA